MQYCDVKLQCTAAMIVSGGCSSCSIVDQFLKHTRERGRLYTIWSKLAQYLAHALPRLLKPGSGVLALILLRYQIHTIPLFIYYLYEWVVNIDYKLYQYITLCIYMPPLDSTLRNLFKKRSSQPKTSLNTPHRVLARVVYSRKTSLRYSLFEHAHPQWKTPQQSTTISSQNCLLCSNTFLCNCVMWSENFFCINALYGPQDFFLYN